MSNEYEAKESIIKSQMQKENSLYQAISSVQECFISQPGPVFLRPRSKNKLINQDKLDQDKKINPKIFSILQKYVEQNEERTTVPASVKEDRSQTVISVIQKEVTSIQEQNQIQMHFSPIQIDSEFNSQSNLDVETQICMQIQSSQKVEVISSSYMPTKVKSTPKVEQIQLQETQIVPESAQKDIKESPKAIKPTNKRSFSTSYFSFQNRNFSLNDQKLNNLINSLDKEADQIAEILKNNPTSSKFSSKFSSRVNSMSHFRPKQLSLQFNTEEKQKLIQSNQKQQQQLEEIQEQKTQDSIKQQKYQKLQNQQNSQKQPKNRTNSIKTEKKKKSIPKQMDYQELLNNQIDDRLISDINRSASNQSQRYYKKPSKLKSRKTNSISKNAQKENPKILLKEKKKIIKAEIPKCKKRPKKEIRCSILYGDIQQNILNNQKDQINLLAQYSSLKKLQTEQKSKDSINENIRIQNSIKKKREDSKIIQKESRVAVKSLKRPKRYDLIEVKRFQKLKNNP